MTLHFIGAVPRGARRRRAGGPGDRAGRIRTALRACRALAARHRGAASARRAARTARPPPASGRGAARARPADRSTPVPAARDVRAACRRRGADGANRRRCAGACAAMRWSSRGSAATAAMSCCDAMVRQRSSRRPPGRSTCPTIHSPDRKHRMPSRTFAFIHPITPAQLQPFQAAAPDVEFLVPGSGAAAGRPRARRRRRDQLERPVGRRHPGRRAAPALAEPARRRHRQDRDAATRRAAMSSSPTAAAITPRTSPSTCSR